MADKKLPDLPSSMEEDLRKNQYHPFFKKTTKQVWEEAEINHKEIGEAEKCSHIFQGATGGFECTKCHFGLLGVGLNLKDGKLFDMNNEPIF